MATCVRGPGFLFWKMRCDRVAVGLCGQCQAIVCEVHSSRREDGRLVCHRCLRDDSGSWFDWSSSDSSGPGDSGSGDSGGGGDGGGDGGGC